jgi:hypothetical protein
MKAGFAIDTWKLDITKKHFDAAKVEYRQGDGLIKDTLMLYVYFTNDEHLQKIIVVFKDAMAECAEFKKMRN